MGEIRSNIDAKGIATVTLSNPTRMNAMQLQMWRALHETMQTLTNDSQVRVVVCVATVTPPLCPGQTSQSLNLCAQRQRLS